MTYLPPRLTPPRPNLDRRVCFTVASLSPKSKRNSSRNGEWEKEFPIHRWVSESHGIPWSNIHSACCFALQAPKKWRRLHYSPLGQSPHLCLPLFSNLELKSWLKPQKDHTNCVPIGKSLASPVPALRITSDLLLTIGKQVRCWPESSAL